MTVDNYAPQPCLFENIVLFFDHNYYVLSRRDSLIVNCQLLIVNYEHQLGLEIVRLTGDNRDTAQATADVGIAVGAGTDVAVEPANGVLIGRFLVSAAEAAEPIHIQEEKPMETVIKVEGMMCNHCKARVEKVCKAVPGVQDAVVNLAAKTVTVTGSADVEALKQAIRDADYRVMED